LHCIPFCYRIGTATISIVLLLLLFEFNKMNFHFLFVFNLFCEITAAPLLPPTLQPNYVATYPTAVYILIFK
jgi:hypothetical protein